MGRGRESGGRGGAFADNKLKSEVTTRCTGYEKQQGRSLHLAAELCSQCFEIKKKQLLIAGEKGTIKKKTKQLLPTTGVSVSWLQLRRIKKKLLTSIPNN